MTLEEQVTRRDARDLELEGPSPRAVQSWLLEGSVAVITGLLGCIASVIAFRLVRVPWFWFVAGAMLLTGLSAAQVGRLRLLAIGWLTEVAGVTVLLGGAYAYGLFR